MRGLLGRQRAGARIFAPSLQLRGDRRGLSHGRRHRGVFERQADLPNRSRQPERPNQLSPRSTPNHRTYLDPATAQPAFRLEPLPQPRLHRQPDVERLGPGADHDQDRPSLPRTCRQDPGVRDPSGDRRADGDHVQPLEECPDNSRPAGTGMGDEYQARELGAELRRGQRAERRQPDHSRPGPGLERPGQGGEEQGRGTLLRAPHPEGAPATKRGEERVETCEDREHPLCGHGLGTNLCCEPGQVDLVRTPIARVQVRPARRLGGRARHSRLERRRASCDHTPKIANVCSIIECRSRIVEAPPRAGANPLRDVRPATRRTQRPSPSRSRARP